MNSRDIAMMVKAGVLPCAPAAPALPIEDTGANVFTIVEDIRNRLDALDGNRIPDDSHVRGQASIRDERRALEAALHALERVHGY